MLPLGCMVQRRLAAAAVAAAMLLVPLNASAAAAADVDALWNQADGISPESAFYPLQSWLDGLGQLGERDAAQRGLRELAQANADLLNAYSLLLRTRNDSGPQPVAVIDPILATVYNAVTGSNARAPIGSLLATINQSLLNLEGRGSRHDVIRALLIASQDKQSAAERDLHAAGPGAQALLGANRERATAVLEKIQAVATDDDGLAAVLPSSHGQGQGAAKGKAKGTSKGSPENNQPKPKK
jgi:hypothetical protein